MYSKIRKLDLSTIDTTYSDTENKNEVYSLYMNLFKKLPMQRQELLNLYLDGYSMKEITKIIDLKNENYTRKFKYQCKQQSKQLIRQDKRYHIITWS